MKKQTQFQNRQNGVKSVLIMFYGDLSGLGQQENKANSKPNKANFVRVNDGFVIPAEAGDVFSRGKPSPSLRDEAATRRQPTEKKGDLKKQSQFA